MPLLQVAVASDSDGAERLAFARNAGTLFRRASQSVRLVAADPSRTVRGRVRPPWGSNGQQSVWEIVSGLPRGGVLGTGMDRPGGSAGPPAGVRTVHHHRQGRFSAVRIDDPVARGTQQRRFRGLDGHQKSHGLDSVLALRIKQYACPRTLVRGSVECTVCLACVKKNSRKESRVSFLRAHPG